MTGPRPLIPGGHGERRGDIAVKAPPRMPSNFLTSWALDLRGISRRRAPTELQVLGFQSVRFSIREGTVRIILHKAIAGDSTTRFNRDSGNIAVVSLVADSSRAEPELAVFDTGRASIDATRIPTPTSLDDQDAPLSKLTKATPEILKLISHAAGMPHVGSLLAAAFPSAIKQARRWNGTAADEKSRVADMRSNLSGRAALYIRTGKEDREFDPPLWSSGAGHAEQLQYVATMLNTIAAADINAALNEFEKTAEIKSLSSAGRIITRRLVESARDRLLVRSLEAFVTGRMWPLALRLLGVDDGAAQFVRRVAEGRDP
jgi:hypothetical protein